MSAWHLSFSFLNNVIKGEALLTIGYAIFGNKSYSYIHSQIYFHRKHEIIEQRHYLETVSFSIKYFR
jgi:hypothetical protein